MDKTTPDSLLIPCQPVAPVVNEEVLSSFKAAFESVSKAYNATMERIAVCNSRLARARELKENQTK